MYKAQKIRKTVLLSSGVLLFESDNEVFIWNSPKCGNFDFFVHFVVFSWEKYMNNMELYDFHVLNAVQYIYQLC